MRRWHYRESPLDRRRQADLHPRRQGCDAGRAQQEDRRDDLEVASVPGGDGAGLCLGDRDRDFGGQRQIRRSSSKTAWSASTPRTASSSGAIDAAGQPHGNCIPRRSTTTAMVFATSAYGRRRAGEADQGRKRRRQGRRGLLHQENAEPPRRRDPARRLPLRRQRRQRGRLPGLPRVQDRQGHVGRARQARPQGVQRARSPWPTAASTTARRTARCS